MSLLQAAVGGDPSLYNKADRAGVWIKALLRAATGRATGPRDMQSQGGAYVSTKSTPYRR